MVKTFKQFVNENSTNSDVVLPLIQKARDIYGEDKLYGGNYGTFALAIAQIMKDNGKSVTLGILFNDSQELDNPIDIVNTESDVYHVVIEFDGKKYDGTGLVTDDTLLDIAQDQYNDEAPGFFRDVDPFSTEARKVISSETAWNISAEKFYQDIKK